jgi:hypothetical protein
MLAGSFRLEGEPWMLTQDLRPFAATARRVAFLFAIFLLLYFVEFATLPLSVDDELSAMRTNPGVWIEQGRWVTYLVELIILPQPVLPFVPIAIFGVMLCLAFLVFLKPLGITENNLEPYLAFPLFAAFPTWSFLIEFQSNTPSQGIGVLAACGSVALVCHAIVQRRPLRSARSFATLIAAIALSAISIGVYQSDAMLIAALGLAAAIIGAIRDDRTTAPRLVAHLAAQSGVLALGLVVYFLVLAALRTALGLTASAYVDSYIQVGALFADPGIVLGRSFQHLWWIYTGEPRIYGTSAWSFAAIIVVAAASLILTPALRGRPGVRLIALALLPVALLIPFLMNPLATGFMPYRALVAVPTVMWLCAYLALSVPIRWLSWASLAVVAIVVFQTLVSTNLLQASNIVMRQRDATLAAEVYQQIAQANPGFDRSKTYKVVFYGQYRFNPVYPRVETSTAGASFFEWGYPVTYRSVAYMSLLGYRNLSASAPTEELTAIAATMPTWPAQGSVQVKGDITIVRLGEVRP